jgi:hypothetical protein
MEGLTYRCPRTPLVPPGGIDCHVRDMTATVSADVTLAQFQSALAEHGQWLPIDGDSNQSIGSLVSCESTGPLRLGYGAWRDLLLGAQFINGRGELITAGGRTVKNVAGYDFTKFIVGQRGIFATLVTLTMRTYRKPAGAIVARHPPDVRIIRRLIATSLRPQWAMLTTDALWCGYLADETTLAFYRSAISASEPVGVIERSLEQDSAHRSQAWNVDGPVVIRASVPPMRLGELSPILGKTRWAADAAFGIVVGSLESEEQAAPIGEAIITMGGTIKLFRGAFGPILELSTTPAERQIIERLKLAFDPDRKLNPLPWPTS